MLAITRYPLERTDGSRRANQSQDHRVIMVLPDDSEIVVEVLEVSAGGKVRLGITAPEDVKILRGELARD